MVVRVTVVAAWIRTRTRGEELCLISDSRFTGGRSMDSSPKLLALPRGDMALCFAGETGVAYPFMLQAYFASMVDAEPQLSEMPDRLFSPLRPWTGPEDALRAVA